MRARTVAPYAGILLSIIFNLVLPFFGLIGLGFLAGRLFSHKDRGLHWLNIFVFYFALPPLIFLTVANADPGDIGNLAFVAGTTLATYLTFLLVFAPAVLVLNASMTRGALQASAASYGNVGYLGVPLVAAAFGPDVAVAGALILVFDNILQFGLVPLITALDEENGEDWVAAIVAALRRLVLHPLMMAAFLGAVFSAFSFNLPVPLAKLVDLLAQAAGPCALFAIGVTVSLQPLRGIGREFPIILFCKIVIHPALALLILSAIGGIDPAWIGAAVLMASLPTAANVYVLATQAGTYEDGASNVVLVSTAISVVTVSVLLYLIDANLAPVGSGAGF